MKEFRISIHLHFINYKSVFLSIDRERMYEAMNEVNIPEKLIQHALLDQNLVKVLSTLHSTQGCSTRRSTGISSF